MNCPGSFQRLVAFFWQLGLTSGTEATVRSAFALVVRVFFYVSLQICSIIEDLVKILKGFLYCGKKAEF